LTGGQAGITRSLWLAWTRPDAGRDLEAAMRRTLFKSKIHRATVTQADLEYEGSITLDSELMRAADILPYEKVAIWNVTRGSRLETYALEGPAGSGIACVNGAAAHHNRPGDLIIVATFAEMDEAKARVHQPKVVLVDGQNRIKDADVKEVPGPQRRLAV
jgi:aspartate 1-decarboxylase